MADVKFSQFASGGDLQSGDIIVGLRAGVNTKFNSPDDPTSNFLLKSNNLSDVQSIQASFANLGLGSGQTLILTDADFSGGVYKLTNPCPNYVTVLCNTTGNSINLPIANEPMSFSLSEGPYIQNQFGFKPVGINLASGLPLTTLNPPSMINFTLSNNSTSDGAWEQIFRVLLNNGLSGVVDFTSSDSSVNIDASTGQIDLTVSPGAGGSLQDAYNNGSDANIALSNGRPILIKSLAGDEFNIYDDTTNLTTLYEALSTVRGTRPFPEMSAAQFSAISSRPIGLHAFTTDFNVTKYWNGTIEQTYLTVNNVLAGTNITINQNGDGTITVNSAGSGPGGNADYAGSSFSGNTTSTTFSASNTYFPIVITAGLNDIVSSSFVNEVVSILGHPTPCFRYTGSSTQYFQFNFNLFARGSVSGQKTYRFQASIQLANTSIVQTGFVGGDIVLQDLVFPYSVPLSGVVQLNTGDRLYVSVQNLTDTSPIVIQTGNEDIVNVDATQQIAMVWNTITTTSFSMSPNNGYVLNNSALISGTLPVACNVGSLIQINGFGSGGFSIIQNAGQSIIYQGASSTTGPTGNLNSTNAQACVSLRCIVQNTVFQVEDTTGDITLV